LGQELAEVCNESSSSDKELLELAVYDKVKMPLLESLFTVLESFLVVPIHHGQRLGALSKECYVVSKQWKLPGLRFSRNAVYADKCSALNESMLLQVDESLV